MKLDSHQHFWHFNTRDYGWMGNNMSNIKRNFLPAELAHTLQSEGFDGSIAVQARQSLAETNWLLDLANENPIIKGVVGWVDLQSENAQHEIETFAAHPKAVGVRHVLHDEVDDDFMLRPAFVGGVKLLEQYNLAYDILIFAKHLPNTLKFVEQFSENQIFVVDHIAKPSIKAQLLEPWTENMRLLAKHSNVYCKVSGMVTEADWENWQYEDFVPYLDVVFEAFGSDRILIGSDWPVCLVAGSYHEIMNIVKKYIQKFDIETQNKVLGLNAMKAYKLKG